MYYTKLKSGALRAQTSKPKGKPHVHETVVRDEADGQKTTHTLVLYDAASVQKASVQKVCRCGFDRGPGLTRAIEGLFDRGETPGGETRGDVTIHAGSVMVHGVEVGRCDSELKHGYHPAVKLTVGDSVVWFERDEPDLIDKIFTRVDELLKR